MRRFRFSGSLPAGVLLAGTLSIALAIAPRAGLAQTGGPAGAPHAFADLAASSSECCLMLLYPIGARRASLSEAVTSITSADAVFYNPAGLAEMRGGHFVLHHVESMTQQVDAFTLLFTPGDIATFGISYELVDFGDQETGGGPVPTGRLSYREHILIASFATTLVPQVAAGLNYKYFASRLNCSGQCEGIPPQNAVTHGLDFGVQYRPHWLTPMRVGVALLNVGFPLQVINSQQADPMPTRLRLGVSYDLMRHIDADAPYELWIMVDAEEEDWQRPSTPIPSVAVEFAVGEVVFLRGGYGGGEGIASGFAVGVGLIYSNFNISVAKRVTSGGLGDDPFQVSLDVGF